MRYNGSFHRLHRRVPPRYRCVAAPQACVESTARHIPLMGDTVRCSGELRSKRSRSQGSRRWSRGLGFRGTTAPRAYAGRGGSQGHRYHEDSWQGRTVARVGRGAGGTSAKGLCRTESELPANDAATSSLRLPRPRSSRVEIADPYARSQGPSAVT